jgi:DNA-binding PadR family transcriptional regulator
MICRRVGPLKQDRKTTVLQIPEARRIVDYRYTDDRVFMPKQKLVPLPLAAFQILLALAGEDRHGYGIIKEVARQSQGHYRLGSGTLYDNLQKLMDRGLVGETTARASKADPPRRYYRLTEFGRRVLEADLVRLKTVLREARLHLRTVESGKAS